MQRSQSLPEGIQAIIDKVEGCEHLTPSLARQILGEATLAAADLEPWTDFDHPSEDSYGRKMIHDGGFFELMAMSWVDGDMAAIHDHGSAQWGAVRLFGRIEHAVFKIRDGVMTTTDRRCMPAGTVLAVSHEMIHQMGNCGQDPYVTLHLYGCYGREGGVTADARLYDLDEDRIQFTDGGVFFSLPEDKIKRRSAGPSTDFATRLRFKVELLRRLNTSHDSWRSRRLHSQRQRRLADELFAASTWQALVEEFSEAGMAGSDSSILHQELRAAAGLQAALLRAGLVEADLDLPRLEELLALAALDEFADGYLDLLARTYDLELSPMAVA